MKKWNFKIKSKPQEVVNKLDIALQSFGGFIFKIEEDKKDAVVFNFRKPIKYPDQILHRNRTIVNGKLLKTGTGNETEVEISFTQHFFMTLTVLSVVIFGVALLAMIPKISSGVTSYVIGGIVLAVGGVLWMAIQKKFESDRQKYKRLISEILAD